MIVRGAVVRKAQMMIALHAEEPVNVFALLVMDVKKYPKNNSTKSNFLLNLK